MSVLQQFVVSGGWITWCVLIPLSLLTGALALHYAIVLRRSAQTPVGLTKALVAHAKRGSSREILMLTEENDSMLGLAAWAGVSHLGEGRESARVAIDEAVEERTTKLFRRIEYLNVIGNVSPMIGLLGTVLGMIRAFASIQRAGGGMPDAGKLAGDISMALVTTFWGIMIAIPALTVFALLRNRIDAFAAESVKLCEQLVSFMGHDKQASARQTENASNQTR